MRPDTFSERTVSARPRGRGRGEGLLIRLARFLGGAVAAGVFVLTVVVVVAALLGQSRGFPGPGALSIAAHVLASVVALGLAGYADRRRGAPVFVASLLVVGVLLILLLTQWWG